jgi:hypothetical protein
MVREHVPLHPRSEEHMVCPSCTLGMNILFPMGIDEVGYAGDRDWTIM